MKTDAGVFLKAAKIVFYGDDWFSCIAIMYAAKPLHSQKAQKRLRNLLDRYANAFKPLRCNINSSWFGRFTPEAKERRILALCFAAAMARTGDL